MIFFILFFLLGNRVRQTRKVVPSLELEEEANRVRRIALLVSDVM